ncbi:MAG: glycerate kinase [Nitrososphaerales archaeon]
MPIKNRRTLLSGLPEEEHRARRLVLDAIEAAISSVDPRTLVQHHMEVLNGKLLIDRHRYDLNSLGRIFVIGGGKASGAMAEAMNQILGDRIHRGIVNVQTGTASSFEAGRIELNEARHPVPDDQGVESVKKMLNLVEDVDGRDLVICLISGGGSALIPMPTEGISLEDMQHVTQSLLRSGAHIGELNAVRKHLSGIKGGQLAKKLYPAEVLSLIISDVVGDSLETIASGPTSPDRSTYQDAVQVLKKYRLWQKSPPQVRRLLSKGMAGEISETPKPGDPIFQRVQNKIIGGGSIACKTAAESLSREGLNTLVLPTYLKGEARDAGISLSMMALDVETSNRPVKKPAAIIVGGETTVAVRGNGVGGRNQEVALSFASKIDGMKDVVFASIDTDGLDGNSDAAGAVVDGATMNRAREKGLDALKFLERNDSYSFFSEVGGLILTGTTFTNVNDIAVMVLI